MRLSVIRFRNYCQMPAHQTLCDEALQLRMQIRENLFMRPKPSPRDLHAVMHMI